MSADRTSADRMSADRMRVRAFLQQASARVRLVAMLRGAAAGTAAAGGLLALRWVFSRAGSATGATPAPLSEPGLVTSLALAAIAIAAGIGIAVYRAPRSARSVALAVEQRVPSLHNLLVTAEELDRAPGTGAPLVQEASALVWAQADARTRPLQPSALFPVARAARELLVAGMLLLVAVLLPAGARGVRDMVAARVARAAAQADAIAGVEVRVAPPAYSGGATRSESNPARVMALSGSTLQFTVRARGARIRMANADGPLTVRASAANAHVAEMRASDDGFVAIEAIDSTGRVLSRRLIGITATPDLHPRVRVAAPARDLVLRTATQSIALQVEADDDLALQSLTLRYTKVSGSGERFTFAEGEVPLQVSRRDGRNWTARANWSLAGLGLVAGDMVVYRAVAADRVPGRAPAESDAFIAQLFASDGDAAPGFAVDPDEERQALSQQMVIVKTERLLARRASIPADSFADQARGLAIEQRRVRAEFVFMMGGEMSEAVTAENSMGDLDESHEAESESDLSAGRMANQGRTALLAAIRAMSRAAAALGEGNLQGALPEERTAVTQLERAFSRSRYLMRALTQREALDLTRRGTGALTDAHSDRRVAIAAQGSARVSSLRTALGDLMAVSPRIATASATSITAVQADLGAIAERVLRIDPASLSLQTVAGEIDAVTRGLRSGKASDARVALDRATSALSLALSAGIAGESAASSSPLARQIEAQRK